MRVFNMVSGKEYDKIQRERDYILLSILTYVDTIQDERKRNSDGDVVHEISEEKATHIESMSTLLDMLMKDTEDDDYWKHEILRRKNRQPDVMEIRL